MKRHKQRTKKKLSKARAQEELERLRERVSLHARTACEESRVSKCMSRYTQFAIEPDGALSCGFKPLREINRNECRQFIEAGFEPVDRKGLIELLVIGVERAGRGGESG